MACKKQPIVIGLDFGTTHSGLAWAPTGSYITPVSGWPARLGANSDKEKAPSALVFRSNSRPPFWGYDIPPHETAVKWFKLLLLDEDDLPQNFRRSDYLRRANIQLGQNNRHPIEATGDYLRELWKYGLQNMENCLGKCYVSVSKLELVVTLPAIWPLYTRQRMREAIQLVGILNERKARETSLSFIYEPEAAALATIEDFSDTIKFKKNDHFVVCDAGGGTVDLISYKVIRENPVQVRECVQGDGKLCGAVCHDERFFNLLKSKIPRNIWDKLGKPGIDHIMEFRWENGLKTQFHRDGTDLQIQMPYGGTRDSFSSPETVFQQELMNVFKPIVAEVVELVNKQIREVMKKDNRAPKFVILAGGFGKSRVLRQALQDSLDEDGFDTEILQARGDRPWTAVCRGAVLRGFDKCSSNPFTTVDARVERASYGTTMNIVPWDAEEHDLRDRVWCGIQREFLAFDQTQWFIKIGETLGTEDHISHSFWQDFDEPPTSSTPRLSTARPKNRRRDATARSSDCMIKWSKIPSFDKLPVWTNKRGKRYRQVHYKLRMVPDGASLDFEVFYEGLMVGSKNVQVDCTDSGALAHVLSAENRKK